MPNLRSVVSQNSACFRIKAAALFSVAVPVFFYFNGISEIKAESFDQPSFDCRLARRPDEKTICSNQILSRLDVIYSRNYAAARMLSGPKTADLARMYNRDRANCGFDFTCIRTSLISGIDAFQRLGAPGVIPAELRPTVVTPSVAVAVAASSPPAGPAPNPSQTTQIVVQSNSAETTELRGQVAQLNAMLKANQDQKAAEAKEAEARKRNVNPDTPELDENELALISDRFEQAASNHALYLTPTRPDDHDLGQTARASSEAFPKVPFYIPGTKESGRFWVEPRVSDGGILSYDMTFVDPRASVDQKRSIIDLSTDQLERMKVAISKLSEWSTIAHRNEVRRAYRKRVDCFPEISCPNDGEKLDGKSSTEVIFIVNEDGSTAGRIQRNKGRYDEGHNISIKSARLLTAYLKYVQSRGEKEFLAGTRTSADLNEMFK